eukprot:scaffold30415_cov124-Isochrysis_galbana.AAC.10
MASVEVDRAVRVYRERIHIGLETTGKVARVIESDADTLTRCHLPAHGEAQRRDLPLARVPKQRPTHRSPPAVRATLLAESPQDPHPSRQSRG